MQKRKILFVIGSPNQTTQMHQIAMHLQPDFDCYFSQVFVTNRIAQLAVKSGLFNNTVLSGQFKKSADNYLIKNNLKNDYSMSGYNNTYDLAVLCTDLVIPKKLMALKTVWVQEGMTDPITIWAKIVSKLDLPNYFSMSTALNGSGNICDIYCAASEGYKEHFTKFGTNPAKIAVTGMPNYDNIHSFLNNDFPHKNYVMVATSDIREVFGIDNRKKFIADVVKIAKGRRILFKLHPNENKERASEEIRAYAPPDTLIFSEGNTNHMIANCEELVTQYSTVVYVGIILGKKVHSYFDVDELKKLTPIQNGGTSAKAVADICRNYISFRGTGKEFLKRFECIAA